MTGIKLDATWVGGYAKLAADSGDALADGVEAMAVEPLTDESFGQLGRQLRTPEAYSRAAGLLRGQLARAVEALHGVSDGLNDVTTVYQETDESSRQAISRELP
ncbi:hypothetical protein [Actinophytocola sp.]|uniref:hypothetical protein n=1 Tax=Actinophytocola sp. TaxID=1872138 RepID=UPI00389A87B6